MSGVGVVKTTDLNIRRATPADLPALNRLYAGMDGQEVMDEGLIADLFDRIQAIPNYRIYLAELEEKGVGTFSLLLFPTMMHRGVHRSALLDAVTVLPELRSHGIGKWMIKQALNLCQDAGCYKLMLSSNLKREQAHAFYASLGFQQHGWSFSLSLAENRTK